MEIAGYIICTIIGAIVGFFLARYNFKKNLIRAMFREMGRKPSEVQINRIMKSINDQYK